MEVGAPVAEASGLRQMRSQKGKIGPGEELSWVEKGSEIEIGRGDEEKERKVGIEDDADRMFGVFGWLQGERGFGIVCLNTHLSVFFDLHVQFHIIVHDVSE